MGSSTGPPRHDAAANALLARKHELEAALEKLRFRKSEMTDAAYQQQLETLVLELARVNRQIVGGHE